MSTPYLEARHNRERIRFTTTLSLMGETSKSIADHMATLADAMHEWPDGCLVFTHGPLDATFRQPQKNTFHNLVALSWQDDDDGSQYHQNLWMRP